MARSRLDLVRMVVFVATASLFASACLDRPLVPVKACVTNGFVRTLEQNQVSEVDLLFMVDNSGSMEAEQNALRRELPRLVESLTAGVRSDGSAFTPVADLHVAIVTSDMGVGLGANAPGCDEFGDDGVMLSEAATSCGTSDTRYLAFRTEDHPNLSTDAQAFGNQFGCIANVGINGCGIEQQLDSVLKALTPASNASISFLGGTHGHGSDLNSGFLRQNSIVAVILVTDEDDCSATPEFANAVYNRDNTTFPDNQNVRCQLHSDEAAYSVERYLNGLRALRPGHEDRVVFGAITGVPQDLVGNPEAIDYDAILNDDRMQLAVGDCRGTPCILPACEGTGGSAAPARRIVDLARRFGSNGIVQSICQDDFGPALGAIIDKIAVLLDRVCLPRRLNPNSDGLVGCDVIQRLPAPSDDPSIPTHCSDVVGVDPVPFGFNEGREECRMLQVPVVEGVQGDGEGWYYDDFSAEARTKCGESAAWRIAFTHDALPVAGSVVHLECLQRVQSASNATIDIGSFCNPAAATDICAGSITERLFCEPTTRSCQIACETDADCPSAFLCAAGAESGSASYCVNPVCTSTQVE